MRIERCPTCDSPKPELHPAMQFEGEVQPCRDAWHSRDPRTDPMPGDQWVNGVEDREVDSLEISSSGEPMVCYVGSKACSPVIRLSSFRRWASGAEYLGRATPPSGSSPVDGRN